MALPTTRVLAVLELLQSHGRMSGPELARRVGVDVRTLRRYVVMLEELGIPVTTERGRHGAYLLVAGFKLPPMMFTNDEAVALAVGMVAARGLGLADGSPAVASAQAKLARVMPPGLQRHVHAIADTVTLEQRATSAAPGSNAALIALATAAQARQRVRLGYDAHGRASERDFDCYGVAWRAGRWYAVGWCHLRRGLRSFRLDRVTVVAPLPLHFVPPADFDPLRQLIASIAAMPRGRAIEVLLHADLATAQAAFPAGLGVFEPRGDGVLLSSSADDMGWFARQLAGVPFDFEIRTPDALRCELARCAQRLRAIASAAD